MSGLSGSHRYLPQSNTSGTTGTLHQSLAVGPRPLVTRHHLEFTHRSYSTIASGGPHKLSAGRPAFVSSLSIYPPVTRFCSVFLGRVSCTYILMYITALILLSLWNVLRVNRFELQHPEHYNRHKVPFGNDQSIRPGKCPGAYINMVRSLPL